MIETSDALEKIYYQYTHLPIGGKEIVCPYWMNNLKKRIFGRFGGKGKPGQIVLAAEEEASREKLNLSEMTEEEIITFLKDNNIGVDCSGFAFQMLNALDIEKGGNGICDDIPHCQGIIYCRANVKMLTQNEVSFPITEINKIKVGDMLRLRGGKHIAIITKIDKEQSKVREIIYAHSSELSETTGVHEGKIIIGQDNLGLEKQNWLEKTAKGSSYKTQYFPGKGDGVRRLNIWG